MSNKLANPNNSIQLTDSVNCGCADDPTCQAIFSYVYDSGADTLTVTNLSILAAGDAIASPSGAAVTVSDSVQPVSVSASAVGDGTTPIVVPTATLSTAGTFKIDFAITTDSGCVSSVQLFFDPNNPSEASGSNDPYA